MGDFLIFSGRLQAVWLCSSPTALRIHRDLGPGLLESVYEAVLARALDQRGFQVERQPALRFEYQGMGFEEGFRVDLLVDTRVIVELKSVEPMPPFSLAYSPAFVINFTSVRPTTFFRPPEPRTHGD